MAILWGKRVSRVRDHIAQPLVLLSCMWACGNSSDHPPNLYADEIGIDQAIIKRQDQRRYVIGDVLPSDMSWDGVFEAKTETGPITLESYHDPDGSKGINALLISEGHPLCSRTLAETTDLPDRLAGGWKTAGIHEIQLFLRDTQLRPATVQTAVDWKTVHQATWAVGTDPGFTFARQGLNELPVRVLVDPRTLVLTARQEGYYDFPAVEQLASKNQPGR